MCRPVEAAGGLRQRQRQRQRPFKATTVFSEPAVRRPASSLALQTAILQQPVPQQEPHHPPACPLAALTKIPQSSQSQSQSPWGQVAVQTPDVAGQVAGRGQAADCYSAEETTVARTHDLAAIKTRLAADIVIIVVSDPSPR
ncbi:hypothetical protein ABW21_db0200878 [Orbilia brochopaga]|nr:hypothetical protein ABW21_db0200878 [Drechslerella brochopaga]